MKIIDVLFVICFMLINSSTMAAKKLIEKNTVASFIPIVKPTTVKNIVLIDRLKQIQIIDKSTLSKVEKKELRKEVRKIRREIRTNNNGIYISVSAAIIIILLLILIL
jgi:hypothetical protein